MAVRHRAFARVGRHVPQVAVTDTRALARTLVARDVDPPVGPRVAGESVSVRDEVHERALRGPEAGPNSPLLIRLVRFPYGMSEVAPQKRPNTARPDVSELHPHVEARDTRAALARDPVTSPSPVRHPTWDPIGVDLAIHPAIRVTRR